MHQICDITQPATNTISVKVQPVQQQSNQVDCGVFSIAFAVILALGDNPALVTYEQTSLRFHLNKCLKLGKFSQYPLIHRKQQKRAKEITITNDIYCTCRRTYFQEDTEESPYNVMAPCCICEDWYHKKCMNIPVKVFRSDTVAEVWKCKSCKTKYL